MCVSVCGFHVASASSRIHKKKKSIKHVLLCHLCASFLQSKEGKEEKKAVYLRQKLTKLGKYQKKETQASNERRCCLLTTKAAIVPFLTPFSSQWAQTANWVSSTFFLCLLQVLATQKCIDARIITWSKKGAGDGRWRRKETAHSLFHNTSLLSAHFQCNPCQTLLLQVAPI